MNWLDRFIKLVPAPVVVLAGALFSLVVIGIQVAVWTDSNMQVDEQIGLSLLSFVAGGLLAFYFLLIGFIHNDARRRLMRHALWTWIAILIPNGIGILLYFVLRDPLPRHCHHCGEVLRKGFAYCPRCAAPAQPLCSNCRRPLEAGWIVCPACGARTGVQAPGPADARV